MSLRNVIAPTEGYFRHHRAASDDFAYGFVLV